MVSKAAFWSNGMVTENRLSLDSSQRMVSVAGRMSAQITLSASAATAEERHLQCGSSRSLVCVLSSSMDAGLLSQDGCSFLSVQQAQLSGSALRRSEEAPDCSSYLKTISERANGTAIDHRRLCMARHYAVLAWTLRRTSAEN